MMSKQRGRNVSYTGRKQSCTNDIEQEILQYLTDEMQATRNMTEQFLCSYGIGYTVDFSVEISILNGDEKIFHVAYDYGSFSDEWVDFICEKFDISPEAFETLLLTNKRLSDCLEKLVIENIEAKALADFADSRREKKEIA